MIKIGLPKGYSFSQEIEIKNEKEHAELKELMSKSIFRPVDQHIVQEIAKINSKIDNATKQEESGLKRFKRWYKETIVYPILKERQKRLTKQLIRDYENDWTKMLKDWYVHAGTQMEKRSRFNRIHNYLKTKFMYPAMKFFAKKAGKYLVQNIDDIPKEWYNNHARIFFHSFEQGLVDMWYHFKYQEKSEARAKFKSFEDFMAMQKSNEASHKSRMFALQIALTEVLEDTVDREWLNFSMLRLTHEMMEHYGVSEKERKKVPKPGEYPIFLTSVELNPKYFFENRDKKVVEINESEDKFKCQKIRKEVEI